MSQDHDVTFVDHADDDVRFVVRGVTPAFANGVRRAMIADVPTMSVDTVRVIENSSVMFDEQIGLRLGLVPLTTPVGEFQEGDSVTLELDVAGPDPEDPAAPETVTAYSGDLRSADGMVQPAEEEVPIIDLKPGQRLQLEAEAVLGYGRDHARHQGGVAVGYRHLQTVGVEGDRDEFTDEERAIVRGVIEESEAEHVAEEYDAEDGDLVPTESFDNDLSKRYPGKDVTVEDVPDAFVFHVETDGSLTVDELVLAAVETLHDRAAELTEAVQL